MTLATPEYVEQQLDILDLEVRRAIKKGTIFEYLQSNAAEIVSQNSLFI
jgi:hypothetical protein